jgi:hypothetical protein
MAFGWKVLSLVFLKGVREEEEAPGEEEEQIHFSFVGYHPIIHILHEL